MTTTTDYGSWCNHGDHFNVSVEATVLDFINGGGTEWCRRVHDTGAFERMVSDYRDAIDDALPEGVRLVGDEFIGPAYAKDHTWEGDLDISEIIQEIDLSEIVQRHDPDLVSE